MVKGKVVGQAEQLGGIGAYVAQRLGELTGKETRSVVLGHLQRGGSPTTFDRLISLKCGAEAVRMVEEGAFNQLVILKGFKTKRVPIPQIAGGMKNRAPRWRRRRSRGSWGFHLGTCRRLMMRIDLLFPIFKPTKVRTLFPCRDRPSRARYSY